MLRQQIWRIAYIEKINNFSPGGSWPHGSHFSFQACIAMPIEWVLKRTPIIKDASLNAENIQDKFGILGETTVMSLAWYFNRDF